MEIFQQIYNSEKYFNRQPTMFPSKKKLYIHGDALFLFYKPSDEKIANYIKRSSIHYMDFIAYGKVVIDDMVMLLIFVDFKYYGISKDGTTMYLGKTISDLKILGTKKWKDFVY
ncbi:ORF-128 [Teiidae poxvirus 1]|nr:ORF-128 [Teiidae poxvirus 1]